MLKVAVNNSTEITSYSWLMDIQGSGFKSCSEMWSTGKHSEELKDRFNDLTCWAYHWGSGKAFK